jgi:hypothetical protein
MRDAARTGCNYRLDFRGSWGVIGDSVFWYLGLLRFWLDTACHCWSFEDSLIHCPRMLGLGCTALLRISYSPSSTPFLPHHSTRQHDNDGPLSLFLKSSSTSHSLPELYTPHLYNTFNLNLPYQDQDLPISRFCLRIGNDDR